ncbi:hypothetical protein V5S96_02635 [Corynebacterium mastitidis]|uniref:DUF3558 domain-containing protein n=1 Tax=Corynebacterium mastitidis TaxID=161890 RepID=A0ABU8NWA7_9CORY
MSSGYNYDNDEWESALERSPVPVKAPARNRVKDVLWVFLGILIAIAAAFSVWFFSLREQAEDGGSSVVASGEGETTSAVTDHTIEASNPVKESEEPEPMQETAASTADRCGQDYWPSGFSRPSVSYCDGQWMRIGSLNTDHIEQYSWNGEEWQEYSFDGYTDIGDFGCYDPARLDRDAVPAELREKLIVCKDQTPVPAAQEGRDDTAVPRHIGSAGGQSSQTIACDDRYILIVQSVIDSGNEEATRAEIASALNAHSGSVFTAPGNCPSLRASVNGNDIYPIYLDFGDDMQAACRAKAVRGGNVRTLNTEGDFSDPC